MKRLRKLTFLEFVMNIETALTAIPEAKNKLINGKTAYSIV
jgi:hypothetical protein